MIEETVNERTAPILKKATEYLDETKRISKSLANFKTEFLDNNTRIYARLERCVTLNEFDQQMFQVKREMFENHQRLNSDICSAKIRIDELEFFRSKIDDRMSEIDNRLDASEIKTLQAINFIEQTCEKITKYSDDICNDIMEKHTGLAERLDKNEGKLDTNNHLIKAHTEGLE